MPIKRTFLIFFVFLAFTACEKVSAFDVESIEERKARQAELLKMLDARVQVKDVIIYSDYYSISFVSNESFHFSMEGTPIFIAAENGEWYVNGVETRRSVIEDGDAVMIPEIGVDVGGNWVIDGIITDVIAHSSPTIEDLDNSYIAYILVANEMLYVILNEGEPVSVRIIRDSFYHVPDYFQECLVTKERLAENAILQADGDYDAFVFFTDAHWGYNYKHSPAIIRHITDYTPVTKVFFGGDVVTNNFSNLVAPMQLGLDFQSSFSFLGPRFYCLYGNHDNNSAGQPSKTELHLSEEQVMKYLQSQMTELNKKEGYNFFFDNYDSKTRYIGLDTGRYNNASFRTTSIETAKFLIDALSDTPEGWHVVALSHIWALYKKVDDTEISVFNSFFNSFLNIINDYNDRKSGKYTYKTQSVEYDFSSCGAFVECCIGGHTHLNSILSYKEVLPVLIVGKDSMKRPSSYVIEGTLREQRVAIVVMDYKNRKIRVFFVGVNDDLVIDLPIL